MLFLLQAMFWAGFGDPARGRPPPCFSVPASPRALALAACAARDIIPSPHGHTTKKFGCLRRAPKTNPTKRRRFNKHGNVVVRWSMLSLYL
jgi:hypothetical protein